MLLPSDDDLDTSTIHCELDFSLPHAIQKTIKNKGKTTVTSIARVVLLI